MLRVAMETPAACTRRVARSTKIRVLSVLKLIVSTARESCVGRVID
jgi:hypothetical protein